MNWISILKQIPPMLETVLLSDGDNIWLGWRESWDDEDLGIVCAHTCIFEHHNDALFWMSLPIPPQIN